MPGKVRNPCAVGPLLALIVGIAGVAGCSTIPIPIRGQVDTRTVFQGHTDVSAHVSATLDGPIELKLPAVADPGPLQAIPLQGGSGHPGGPRIALIDLDGLILNQAPIGPYSAGENPLASFREKLEAAAADPFIRAVVLRINSPGGSVTACDILAEELQRFRAASGKPVVCCLMDLGTSGAYYLAVGGDRILAHPTTITGGIGALINRYNLEDAMAQLNIRSEPIKSAPLVDMGTLTAPLDQEAETLLQGMADGFAARFRNRVERFRPRIDAKAWETLDDGRVLPAPVALDLGLIDRIGYLPDAIAEAEQLAGLSQGAEVVLYQRKGYPGRSIYAVTPNAPIQEGLIPFSYPGLDRAKVPTFLYLWSLDPTILPRGGS